MKGGDAVLKKIIIILTVILLLVGGGAGAYFFLSKGKDKDKKGSEEINVEELKALVVDIPVDTYTLAGMGQYAKISLSIQAKDAEAKEEATYRTPEIRAMLVKELSTKTSFELRGGRGFDTLQKLVEENVKSQIKTGEIESVNITTLQLQN